jgi:hypothetical protein
MSEKSLVGKLIDGDIEEVADAVNDLSYTKLLNLKKQIEIEYQRLTLMKDKLIENREEENNAIRENEIKKTVNEIYVAMQKIEDIATVVEKIKEERSLDSN